VPDLSDIEQVLVSLLAQIAYPHGTAAESATGDPVKIYRGWPIPSNLDADVRAGIVNVSVYPLDGEQNVTRYSTDWERIPSPRVTMTVSVSGTTATFGGRACCPLNAAIVVNGTPFVYPLQATDTPTSVATALAALVSTTYQASSSGATITVPNARRLEARLGTIDTIVQEVKRQKRPFRITAWCSTPAARDRVGALLDAALAGFTDIALTDGTSGRIRYVRSLPSDAAQKSMIYRRDLVYSVEYGTFLSRPVATIVAEQVNVTAGATVTN
jgi:hypothetical protein